MGDDTRKFLEVLYGDLGGGQYIEVRFIPPRDESLAVQQRWADNIDTALVYATHPPRGYDSYVGVLPRTGRLVPESRPGLFNAPMYIPPKDGSAAQVERAGVLWADIDSYKGGRDTDQVLEELRALPCPPTMVVHSGGGLHVYWTLTAPVLPAEAAAYMRRLADAVGGDRATAEVARVLRVPGTSNNKQDTPRMVRLLHVNVANTYAPQQITEWLGEPSGALDSRPLSPNSVATRSALGERTRRFLENAELPSDVPERTSLLGIARNLREAGWDSEDALGRMWDALERFGCTDPERPWAWEHVAKIVESIWSSEPTTTLDHPPITMRLPQTTARLASLSDDDFNDRDPEIHYIVDPWLHRAELVMLTGQFGTGKSWLALDLALAVADPKRETWLGAPVSEHGPVLYFDEENHRDGLLERLALLGYRGGGLLGSSLHVFSFSGLALDDPDWTAELHDLADRVRPRLCVFDTFIRFSALDENDNSSTARMYREALVPLSRMFGSAVLVLDHPRKGSAETSRGASDKVNVLDRGLALVGEPGSDTAELRHVKFPRRGRAPLPVSVTRQESVTGVSLVVNPTTEPDGAGRPPIAEYRDVVLAALPAKYGQIAEGTGIPKRTVSRVLRELEDAGTIVRAATGEWCPNSSD